MTARSRVKAPSRTGQLVAVLSSPADLQHAFTLHRAPDVFEVRLDALFPVLPEAERFIAKLRVPLIFTARHSAEAGMHNLSPGRRCELLLRFLSLATFVDVELRSVVELRAALEAAKRQRVTRIISVHDFRRTPPVTEMEGMCQAAKRAGGDIFKIVTRTDTEEDVARLLEFFDRNRHRHTVSAMGTGRLGCESRVQLAQHGSVLNYSHLGNRVVEGQLSLTEMRRRLG